MSASKYPVLLALATDCGAVSYSPPPMRAVRGISMTHEAFDAFVEKYNELPHLAAGLAELMRKCREEKHDLTYADLQALVAGAVAVDHVPDAGKMIVDAIGQPDKLEEVIDAYVGDYECMGENAAGTDGYYSPNEHERYLIKDAIIGLLADQDWDAAWGAHIASLAATPPSAAPAEPITWENPPPHIEGRMEVWLTAGSDDLNPHTKNLVVRFARAMAKKLLAAEQKYGYTDGWRSPDWMDECRAKLLEHIAKGDPVDVANYCAFLWFHGASTASGEAGEVQVDAARLTDAQIQDIDISMEAETRNSWRYISKFARAIESAVRAGVSGGA
jgi:hypothetical protein